MSPPISPGHLEFHDDARLMPRVSAWHSETSFAYAMTDFERWDAICLRAGDDTKALQSSAYRLGFDRLADIDCIAIFRRRLARFDLISEEAASNVYDAVKFVARRFPLLGWAALRSCTNSWPTSRRMAREP